MRVTVFAAAALGSVVALVGFAGAASASATIDLIWIDVINVDSDGNPICLQPANRDCPQLGTTISSVAVTDNITLGVIIAAGPGGIFGASVSVNYGDALPVLSVTKFGSLTTPISLPLSLGPTTNEPPFIDSIAASMFHGYGIGLSAGQTAYLGTVSFHKDLSANGTFEITVGVDGPREFDDVLDRSRNNISSTTTFNSAFLVDIDPTPTPTATPTPFCSPAGASCTKNADCCSNQCSGPGGNKVCQPGPTPTATPTPTPEPNALTALGSGSAMLALLYRRRRHSVER